ncbi:MAG: 2-hydroxyacid dehydrogenase [Betaproteobacteria bacterium]
MPSPVPSMGETRPVLVVEDDPFTRIVQVVLDPEVEPGRVAAFASFFSHDVPDFSGWLSSLRPRLENLYPARVRLVASQEALQDFLPAAHAAVVEGLAIGAGELARAPLLRVVQKFGVITTNIDQAGCAARGIPVLALRRRANMACAEHALGMMLALARKIGATNGLISEGRLREAGYAPGTYDRRHTANSNWARITGIRTLVGARLGIVGLGEIGRELAVRAAACGMRLLYTQRRRLDPRDEAHYGATYCTLEELLPTCDFISLNLPGNPTTRGIVGRRELDLIKPGAVLVNISRADLIDRTALIEALRAGRLGGFATDLPYEEPGRDDDPLLGFRNVILTPHIAAQPRFNALDDLEELLLNLDRALAGARC